MSSDGSAQRIVARPFRHEEDFWRIRRLLISTYATTALDFNWDVRRWDGWRFYRSDPAPDPSWSQRVRLWETTDECLVAVAHPEGSGDVHLQLHPAYRFLEEDMIAWAEAHLSCRSEDGPHRSLSTFVFDYDSPRRRLLEKRGYERTPRRGIIRRLDLRSTPRPIVNVAAGYRVRTSRPEDCDGIAALLNAAFHRDCHCGAELRVFAAHGRSFRRDLDLIAETPGGALAAYVGAAYDPDNRRAVFEPVCTHPAHTRQGLARTLILEAIRRLRTIGADAITVGTGDAEAANRLYDSLGFTESHRGCRWRKKT